MTTSTLRPYDEPGSFDRFVKWLKDNETLSESFRNQCILHADRIAKEGFDNGLKDAKRRARVRV